MFHLRIKSFQDAEIDVPAESLVSHVKQKVRVALAVDKGVEEGEERYLRLICKGHLLSPDDRPITEFNVVNGDVVHAVLAPAGQNRGNTATVAHSANATPPSSASSAAQGQAGSRRRRRRGAGIIVGPGGRVTRAPSDFSSSSEEEFDEETGRRIERRGFDILRSTENNILPIGRLSRSEVSAIRVYFSRHVDQYIQDHPEAHSDEPDLWRRRLLTEEDWMEAQGPTSEFRLNLSHQTALRALRYGNPHSYPSWAASRVPTVGTDRDFMWGFMLGFFVGFAMMVWVWMPSIPLKQKLGILAGISFHMLVSVLEPPPSSADEEFGTNATVNIVDATTTGD